VRLNPLLKLKRRKSKSLPWKKQDHRMTFRQLSKTKEEAGSGPLAPALPNPLLKLKKRQLSLTKKNKKKWLKKKCKSSQQSMRRTPLKKVR